MGNIFNHEGSGFRYLDPCLLTQRLTMKLSPREFYVYVWQPQLPAALARLLWSSVWQDGARTKPQSENRAFIKQRTQLLNNSAILYPGVRACDLGT